MNPELAKRIMELPEGRELLEEIKNIVLRLDSISEVKFDDPIEFTTEGKGRIRAVEIITLELLDPLLDFVKKEEEPSDDEGEDAGIK